MTITECRRRRWRSASKERAPPLEFARPTRATKLAIGTPGCAKPPIRYRRLNVYASTRSSHWKSWRYGDSLRSRSITVQCDDEFSGRPIFADHLFDGRQWGLSSVRSAQASTLSTCYNGVARLLARRLDESDERLLL